MMVASSSPPKQGSQPLLQTLPEATVEQGLLLEETSGQQCSLLHDNQETPGRTSRWLSGGCTRAGVVALGVIAVVGVAVGFVTCRATVVASHAEPRQSPISNAGLAQAEAIHVEAERVNERLSEVRPSPPLRSRMAGTGGAEPAKVAPAVKLAPLRQETDDAAPAPATNPVQQVKDAIKRAQDMKTEADGTSAKAADAEAKADTMKEEAEHQKNKAENELDNAAKEREEAKALREQAQKALARATSLEAKAKQKDALAQADQQAARHKVELASELIREGKTLEENSQKEIHDAVKVEQDALDDLADTRMCMELPGVWLKEGGTAVSYPAIVLEVNLTDSTKCTDWCRKHQSCRQAVFSSEDGSCQLYEEAVAEPIKFVATHNSSFCGPTKQKDAMLAMLHKVYDMKPWIPELRDCTWAGGNCLESHCCANVCVPDALFNNCDWYTCYVKDQYFAGCATGPAPGDWNGTVLGGHATMEIAKADEGKLTQGTKLFCFSVVMWWNGPTMPGMDGEGAVANNWKDKGLHICQCDDWAMFDGLPTGSAHNIDSFTAAWNKVKEDGRYKRNDWVVKVDVDAVFFADRLRWHIQALRTPQGARVYLRNTFYKFHFLGAIEVMTKEAMDLYFDRAWMCDANVGKEGGEDYWLLSCLEGIGVDYQNDYALLRDKYAAQDGCGDDWVVAFHFYKSANGWNYCHDEAYNTWKSKNPGA